MRMRDGADVSYTDGAGTIGRGVLRSGTLQRGEEAPVERPAPHLTLAVAAPRAADRSRMVVEKAAEFGVDRLVWLSSRFSQGRPPKLEKARRWATGALEQSRGAWLLEIDEAPRSFDDLIDADALLLAADPGGESIDDVLGAARASRQVTVAIGPEGGFAHGEIPSQARVVSLGARVLRVETAAIAVAALVRSLAG